MGAIPCPHCGSFATVRQSTRWEWLWLIIAAGSFFMRLLVSFVRSTDYTGEPGVYGCRNRGRAFTYFV